MCEFVKQDVGQSLSLNNQTSIEDDGVPRSKNVASSRPNSNEGLSQHIEPTGKM